MPIRSNNSSTQNLFNKRTKHIKKWHSIFVRLFLSLLAVLLIVNTLFMIFFGTMMGSNFNEPIMKNIQHHADLLALELGSPPDTMLAHQYAIEYNLQIIYEHENFTWFTDPSAMSIASMQQERKPPHMGPGSLWHSTFIVEMADGARYGLRWKTQWARMTHSRLLFGLILAVTLVFIIAHLYFRKVLRPIKILQNGVEEIGRGNLDTCLTKIRDDELGCLIDAFNDMIRRIKEMISARDQLLLDVSHELRSPITRMKLALEFIPDVEKKYNLQKDITEIEMKITELLDSARLDQGYGMLKPEKINLIHMLDDITQIFHARKPTVHLIASTTELMIVADEQRLRTLFKNLLENSVKYSIPNSRPVIISVERQDDQIHIQITDDGPGIPETDLPFIFEPFFKVDRSRSRDSSGYGLGLSLCKKIITAHGGSIKINNRDNRGIIVTLSIPGNTLHG
ncbi:HAMP domain-containing histidine kinase [bacterium]|nr:HAMP domain-containing histidine kinase [bacterium]